MDDKFREKFIVNIKGKDAIKADGLKAVAHAKGMSLLKSHILQYPNKENMGTCIVEAELKGYDWDPINEKIREVEYTAIADANINNCTKMVASAYIRMAETRAFARVMRNYTDVDICAVDELNDDSSQQGDYSKSQPQINYVTSEQANEIKQLMQAKGITQQQGNQMMKDITKNKYATFKSLTFEQANMIIKQMQNMASANATGNNVPTNNQQSGQSVTQQQTRQQNVNQQQQPANNSQEQTGTPDFNFGNVDIPGFDGDMLNDPIFNQDGASIL